MVSHTLFVCRKADDKIIGMTDIRLYLNEFLRNYGGHIGYGVRPSERKKGYAVRILEMSLEYAKNSGLSEVILGCNQENEASRKTILKCGGRLIKEFLHTDGKIVHLYCINI